VLHRWRIGLIIFTPVLLPLVYKLGIDPVFFGVMITVNLMIGTITPPVGLCLYVACGIADVRLEHEGRSRSYLNHSHCSINWQS
jgi:TRAP-type C4-dicarboxylate transport system permease large subunit